MEVHDSGSAAGDQSGVQDTEGSASDEGVCK